MGYVKLDQKMLNSTTWFSLPERNIFITALLMAMPWELSEPEPQLDVETMEPTGWTVPPGWYGMARVAGPALIGASLWDREEGIAALRALGEPEPESRSQDFEGRRLVRINGGYLVLNFMTYRDYDATAAERQRRYRDRKKRREALQRDPSTSRRDETSPASRVTHVISHKSEVISQKSDPSTTYSEKTLRHSDAPAPTASAESEPKKPSRSELEFDQFWKVYPRKVGKRDARKAWKQTEKERPPIEKVVEAVRLQRETEQWMRDGGQFIPHPATWLRQGRWDDLTRAEVEDPRVVEDRRLMEMEQQRREQQRRENEEIERNLRLKYGKGDGSGDSDGRSPAP